ncbi:MAG: hypothetical protein HY289_00335, partial [Planctomycetes bacterium]|nr:hypothetical protein [Planctomycetota bacterium]
MRILGIVGLILMGFFYGANSALPKDGELPKGLRPDVLGAGDDVNAAKASAVREAAKEVEKIMKAHHPPLTSFVLTEDYVSKNVV